MLSAKAHSFRSQVRPWFQPIAAIPSAAQDFFAPLLSVVLIHSMCPIQRVDCGCPQIPRSLSVFSPRKRAPRTEVFTLREAHGEEGQAAKERLRGAQLERAVQEESFVRKY